MVYTSFGAGFYTFDIDISVQLIIFALTGLIYYQHDFVIEPYDDDELVQNAVKNGAKGYLIKYHTPEHLKQMIKSVYNGTGVMEEHYIRKFSKKQRHKSKLLL